MQNRAKIKLLISLFSFLVSVSFFGFNNNFTSYAAVCSATECTGSGEYVCQSGTMCCTGSGCPSYACSRDGASPEVRSGSWTCCYTDENPFSPDYEKEVCSTSWLSTTGGTCSYCTGTEDGSGGGGTTPGCTTADMGIYDLDLTSPPGGSVFQMDETINFSWTPPVRLTLGRKVCEIKCNRRGFNCFENCYRPRIWSEYWGEDCSSDPAGFNLYVDGVIFKTYKTSVKSVSILASDFGLGTHRWYIEAFNHNKRTTSARNFIVEGSFTTVQGTIWDATDSSCSISEASRDSKEIQAADLDGNITVTADGIDGTWSPSGGSQSYTVANVPLGTSKIVCANVPQPKDLPNFKYSLECVNGSTSGKISASCAVVDLATDPATVDLGFKLSSFGWFQVNNADIFAGCSSCIDSISMGIPAAADVLGGFEAALVAGKALIFGNADLSVKNPSGESVLTSDSNNYWAKGLSDANFIPASFLSVVQNFDENTFTNVPNNDCNGLLTGGAQVNNVYSLQRDCAQRAINRINPGTNYSLASDDSGDNSGVTFLFVEGDGTSLEFTDEFKASNSTQRVVFVAQDTIDIDSALGEAAPTTSTPPVIEAGLISEQSINFPSAGVSGDSTIVVEGPLVALQGSINFDRDRLELNGYPTTVVNYNPFYLTGVSDDVKDQVGLVDITWTLEN